MKRIMIAGTGAGCGKTTITCALLKALANRGKSISSFKCGTDYIDPMFHRMVLGIQAYNLDSHFYDKNTLKHLFAKYATEISIVEGVKGFYDGINFTEHTSSYEISQITDTPVILVVDAKGAGNSVGAVIKGFLDYAENNIRGVIFNGITPLTYERLKSLCADWNIRPLGYFPYVENTAITSRYLGLVSGPEIDELKERVEALAKTAEECLDIDGILELCSDAALDYTPIKIPHIADVTIAVAHDSAFCFYYRCSLEILEEMGAKLVYFSPINDEALPDGINGLIIGGGYPELYADKLEANSSMRESIKSAIENGIPCIAECGGFVYLHEYMSDFTNKEYKGVGVIPGACHKTDTVQGLGYIEMTADKDNALCNAGESIRAHEFHYFSGDNNSGVFTARKGDIEYKCMMSKGNLIAGYPHFNLYSNPAFAEHFIKTCAK